MYLLTSTKTRLAALELSRHLGVSYRTAWRLKHKVMQAMAAREESRQLSGTVQVDDVYLGGERNCGKGGRGREAKQAFLAAVEVGEDLEHPRYVVFEPVRHFDNTAILDWSARRLAPSSTVYTEGLWIFRRFHDAGHSHHPQAAGSSRAALDEPRARWVNIVPSNLKVSLDGTYHAIKLNRRFNLPSILPRLLINTVACQPCSEPLLRQASNYLSQDRR